jgi:phage antirepressor YoqD-like protein
LACSGDEFFEALQHFAAMNNISSYDEAQQERFIKIMRDNNFLISVQNNSGLIK